MWILAAPLVCRGQPIAQMPYQSNPWLGNPPQNGLFPANGYGPQPSGIPAGTLEKISHELTDSKFVESQPDVRPRIEGIIRQQSLLLPAVENEFWHASATRFLATTSRAAGTQYHRCHGSLVARVGRLKNPAYRPLEFTLEQRRQILAALQPGDVLLTYTAGFASNYFIPGSFKHAATYVGTEEDRRYDYKLPAFSTPQL